MTQNEHFDLVATLKTLLGYNAVDTVTVVDGGSIDGTIPYMRNWARQDSRMNFFVHPWQDNFPKQRNNYLRRVAEIAKEGDWLLCFDPDEPLDDEACARLREVVEWAEGQKLDWIGFRCRAISLRGDEVVHSNEDDHWKRLLIRWSPELKYVHFGEGPVHEHLEGPSRAFDLGRDPTNAGPFGRPFGTLFYEHRKQENVIWWRGVRNYYCGGGGPNLGTKNPMWVALREATAEIGIFNWHDMLKYLVAGNIDPQIKQWMINTRQADGWDGASEQREWYLLYFRMLHPEEEPEELRGEQIG